MDQELISKKDLLQDADISYGQLYRWKRKQLIPEEWFIRKSTFTGQETFFPKEKILERIEKIKQHKDDLSLDNLAQLFTKKIDEEPQFKNISLSHLRSKEMISQATQDLCQLELTNVDTLSYPQAFTLFVIEEILSSGSCSLEEAKLVLTLLRDQEENFIHKPYVLLVSRKLGVATAILLHQHDEVHFDSASKVILNLSLDELQERFKQPLLTHGGIS
ncbi:Protein of unknown function [Thermoactinomyces sp. DSM 45891]|uniref:DUF4004 family protein n=1 Tax=Thermoactinomyces sp. DSM 45891 TaxID=1761907 RepID=UPI000918CF3B|nr:DUF4004 family protein [Thermoactinomyces sp. DSM 45891]SFX12564.1 Protein of unknown function [Thermoactinomyces sp. DSM 45891]